ncbi:MAG: methyltransferase domain-containing protein [Leptolyngbyaceae cyanobacterium SL_7_1]|nr:methyltransferase domain-containing protein [Leptolyngbyaceae cyanobacterium SL_7_1]
MPTHRYDVKIETIWIGGVGYTIRSLLDLQQFSDPTGEALRLGISSAMWPLFGQVWPMGEILAQVMLGELLKGKRILEIGCGIGLASLVIKQLGGDITASDYHPLAHSFLIENARLNFLAPILFNSGNWNTINPTLGTFDLIIGSDVLYEHQHIQLLSAFIDRHSSDPVNVIIVDPGRGSHRAFAREMERLGYDHIWSDLSDYPVQGVTPKGFILRFWRPSP